MTSFYSQQRYKNSWNVSRPMLLLGISASTKPPQFCYQHFSNRISSINDYVRDLSANVPCQPGLARLAASLPHNLVKINDVIYMLINIIKADVLQFSYFSYVVNLYNFWADAIFQKSGYISLGL